MRNYQQNLAALRMGMTLDAGASTATGQAFLTAELSKIDPIIRLPLENFTYYRDLPLDLGGGWIDYHVARNVDFRGPRDNSTGTQSNDIRVIEYNTNQDTWPVYPYEVRVRIPVVESLKMAAVGRSPQDLLDKGVRVDWSKTLDHRAYQGFEANTGLVNNSAVTSTALPAVGIGGTKNWTNKTPNQVLGDFNFMAYTNWGATGYTPGAMPDRFLIPPLQYNYITQPMVIGGVGGMSSILEYVKKNSLLNAFGIVPEIYPLPYWLDGAGVGSTQQIVAYKYDKDCLSLGIPQEIQRFGGPLSVVSGAFEVLYVGNIGVVKINRPQTIGYFYGA